jgi:hypothetical protein
MKPEDLDELINGEQDDPEDPAHAERPAQLRFTLVVGDQRHEFMPVSKEELTARISAFRNDIRTPSAGASIVTTLCFGAFIAIVMLTKHGIFGRIGWALCLLSAAVGIGAVWWWASQLKSFRQKHGLLCRNCGRFITKAGFQGVLSTSRCEWCNSSL